ncbi:O-acetyl-ADP-ribose deacetylase [Microcoleus sp. LEGE 07076]|uniref:O-acetyl-ADP-ribose deacetylase n=1 Tax=Microcoleus sp. LEGE 07076 TaxID=915322 RepID=UPI00187ED164|nr:O-acetyl-ADP-ribose deacetylase [Microcoleus sp. LEGE 07076]MBE9184362.1 O-acetyl-ADP-ribose deacetylase [Microcoleus sp. LEGE 07076]
MLDRIEVIQGDIIKQKVDAIVNAANESLLGGGGVDGAIHRAAGPGLLEECRILKGCATGEAKITGGYNLPCPWVIHTVGPVWRNGICGEDELLASCYRNSLMLAQEHQIRTIAFPAISTGVFRFPIDRAAQIAVSEIKLFLRNSSIDQVMLVCFERSTYEVYLNVVE